MLKGDKYFADFMKRFGKELVGYLWSWQEDLLCGLRNLFLLFLILLGAEGGSTARTGGFMVSGACCDNIIFINLQVQFVT